MPLALMLGLLLALASSPSPSPSQCDADPQILKMVIPSDFNLQTEGPLLATVAVVIGPGGKIEKATISKSSGDPAFDFAAVRAARQSTYSAKIVDCKEVESTFLYKASFNPGG